MWCSRGFSSTDFSLWGLVVRKAERIGMRWGDDAQSWLAAGTSRLVARISSLRRGDGTPQTEVCATRTYAAVAIAFLLVALPARATTYYVAAAGNDANSGTDSGHPWQTIGKVNGAAFSAGDSGGVGS